MHYLTAVAQNYNKNKMRIY